MICTVMIGNHCAAQGIFVRELEGGRIAVRDGDMIYIGRPVSAQVARP